MVVPSMVTILVMLIIWGFYRWILNTNKKQEDGFTHVVEVTDLEELDSQVEETVEANRKVKAKVQEVETKVNQIKNKLQN